MVPDLKSETNLTSGLTGERDAFPSDELLEKLKQEATNGCLLCHLDEIDWD
jgi:hypothetical protein